MSTDKFNGVKSRLEHDKTRKARVIMQEIMIPAIVDATGQFSDLSIRWLAFVFMDYYPSGFRIDVNVISIQGVR